MAAWQPCRMGFPMLSLLDADVLQLFLILFPVYMSVSRWSRRSHPSFDRILFSSWWMISLSFFLLFFFCRRIQVVHEVFSYLGAKGPGNWGHLRTDFSACSTGTHQSPVDVVTNQTVLNKSLSPLIRGYRPVHATLVNNGFNIGVHIAWAK